MAWLRVDDGMCEHRKVLSLPRKDRWTWMELLTYVARQNNGGHVPDGICDVLRWVTPAFLETCLEAGLLDRDEGGYAVHDWDDYNQKDPSAAERMRRYRERKRDDCVTGSVTEPVTDDVTPPARARARGPSPTPSNPSPTPPQPGEEEEDTIDQERMQAWLDYANRQPGITATLPYARKGYDTGAWPPHERRTPDPSTQCPDCHERLGHGHADDCPTLAAAAARATTNNDHAEQQSETPAPEIVERIAALVNGATPRPIEPAAARTSPTTEPPAPPPPLDPPANP